MTTRKPKKPRTPASTTVELVVPVSVQVGDHLLPGGIAFAMQADRPEMMSPGLCGVPWTADEQRGVLELLADVVRHRGELRDQLAAMKRRAHRAELRLRAIAVEVRDATADLPRVDPDDDDLDGDE